MAARFGIELGASAARPAAARVEAALDKQATERKELRRLVRDEDRRVGYRVRRVFVVVLGTAWIALWVRVALRPPATPMPIIVASKRPRFRAKVGSDVEP